MYSTFLELCQALMEEAGISGTITSVKNQTGERKRVVGWIRRSCMLVEGTFTNWNFLHEFYQFNTVAQISDYPPPSDHNVWDTATGSLPNDQSELFFTPWVRKKKEFQEESFGSPFAFTVLPSHIIRLYDTPNTVVPISMEYYRAPTEMIENTDTPAIPLQYRDIIIYKALGLYAKYENADELLLSSRQDYSMRWDQLRARELPGTQGMQATSTGMDIQVVAGDH